MVGATFQDLLETIHKLAGSSKLRKEVEDDFKKRGMTLKIDQFGIGHLYSPLYVSSLWRKQKIVKEKYSKECNCENCQKNKNKKRKCSHCGKKTLEYVHAIGWECMNRRCPRKIKNKSREQILKKYKNVKLINDI